MDTKGITVYTEFGALAPAEYNKFFHPNICHVCKLRKNGNLVTCDRCHMVSYCSEMHKITHEPQHLDICACIQKNLVNLPEWNTHYLDEDTWKASRKKLVQLVEMSIIRRLQRYETQMLLRPKSCFYCHQRTNLLTCEVCYSENYCHVHEDMFHIQHEVKCKEFILLLNNDLASMKDFQIKEDLRFNP